MSYEVKGAPSATLATWSLALDCDCPKCGEPVNLIDDPDFFLDGNIEPIEHDTERSNNLAVTCPECSHEFEVCCVW